MFLKQKTMKQPKKTSGRKLLGHVQYKRNIHPKLVQPMDDHLSKLKAEFINEIDVKN